jgi:long-chain acyl-CoA synthetase
MLNQFLTLVGNDPEAAALVDGRTGAITTRLMLLEQARSIASELATAGLVSGDLVAIQLPNSVEFIAAFVAILIHRMVAIPIDRDAPASEVANILAHFGVRGLVYRADRTADAISISTRTIEGAGAIPTDARLIKLTSGSTGRPKGIVTSEANLIADCRSICATMQIAPTDLNFGAIPFSHSYGFSNLVTPLLLQGTPIVISNDYLPVTILDLCNRHRCTVFPGIPMIYEHLASLPEEDGKFESITTFLSAGAPLTPGTSRRFRERFGRDVHTFYGCSECGGITYDREGGSVERATVGSAMQGAELSAGEGRLVIRSGAVALGYLHDASTFEPFAAGTFVSDDLAAIDEDGFVHLTGRASEMIITAGKKVNPREVEQVILQLEGVRQVKVYGEPAGARGEVVAAAIVGSPELTRDQVRQFCREKLSLHKVPRIVKLIESIPVDERGKVRRAMLAEL